MDTTFVDRENVFGKLSRIFETHTYRDEGARPTEKDDDELLEGIMSEFESLDGEPPILFHSPRENKGGRVVEKSPGTHSMIDLSFNNNNNRPTPFDVWSSKQKDSSKGVKPVNKYGSINWQ